MDVGAGGHREHEPPTFPKFAYRLPPFNLHNAIFCMCGCPYMHVLPEFSNSSYILFIVFLIQHKQQALLLCASLREDLVASRN